ncbi:MAG: divalent-cation tolerance protein CutA [Desulfobacterales bacterium]|nr:MAG: divalent-cation tolerance protein CutA [Desulfobacterales bacterium]
MSYCLVITTCGSRDEAEKLASQMVETRLAACVQQSSITSYYTWEGKVNHDPEFRLFIKTRKALYIQLEQFIKDNHSYDVPQIIEIPIQSGLSEYLGWIDEVTT